LFNAETLKLTIYKDNKNKSGIYRLTNNITGKSYIGSSINLSVRFAHYYSFAFLNRIINKSNSIICRALFLAWAVAQGRKYGYSNFSLDILEYCDYSILREKEQYYLDKLKPKYNILPIAGSSRGYRHSEATRVLVRAAALAIKRGPVSE
jgi:group I intron endonuclease